MIFRNNEIVFRKNEILFRKNEITREICISKKKSRACHFRGSVGTKCHGDSLVVRQKPATSI